jgi:hypothetical protein
VVNRVMMQSEPLHDAIRELCDEPAASTLHLTMSDKVRCGLGLGSPPGWQLLALPRQQEDWAHGMFA